MIIILYKPKVVYDVTDSVVDYKIYDRKDHVLRKIVYSVLDRRVLKEETENIDSDEYMGEVSLPPNYPPTLPNQYITDIVIVRLQVEDANGNIVEVLDIPVPYSNDAQTLTFDQEVEAWIISKLGYAWSQRGKTIVIPTNSLYYSIIYWEGNLKMYEGDQLIANISGKSAIIQMRFTIDRSIAKVFFNNIDNDDIVSIIGAKRDLLPVADVIGAIKMIDTMLSMRRFTPIGYGVKFDDNYIYITVVTQVDLYTPLDLWGIVKIVVGVLSVVGGALLLVASAGVGAPASYALIASGVSAIISGAIVLTSTLTETPQETINEAESIASSTISDMEKTVTDLDSYLDNLVAQGKITEEEKQKIMDYVNKMVERAKKGLNELKELVKKAYWEGVRESQKWIIVSGVAGFITGVIIGGR
ncbi:MAG: hypothetical protein DRO40_09775 [Thermoprotei archaeon]|nr:MAG: hypothetical protein DRO40_09775 [Thermoprotei archaeon]